MRAVEISVRAQLCIERIDTRWRKKADYPDVFRAEMEKIIENLGTVSSPGTPSPTARRPQLRRMLLEKAKCHPAIADRNGSGQSRAYVYAVSPGAQRRNRASFRCAFDRVASHSNGDLLPPCAK